MTYYYRPQIFSTLLAEEGEDKKKRVKLQRQKLARKNSDFLDYKGRSAIKRDSPSKSARRARKGQFQQRESTALERSL
jgi:hypothetical protein